LAGLATATRVVGKRAVGIGATGFVILLMACQPNSLYGGMPWGVLYGAGGIRGLMETDLWVAHRQPAELRRPVFQLKAGDLLEIAAISRYQNSPVLQDSSRNTQIRAANSYLVLAELLETLHRRFIVRQNL
jgi:hypothetical protein